MTTSIDPNKTSGKEANSIRSLRYPLSENLQAMTRLRFVEYSRLTPNATADDVTTAIINMPYPENITESTSFKIDADDLGQWGNINSDTIAKVTGSGLENMTGNEAVTLATGLISDYIKHNTGRMSGDLLKGIAVAPALPDAIKKPIQSFAGIVQNPHTTMLFGGVNLRSFGLQWRLSPRSAAESDALKQIRDLIRMRTHSEESMAGFALDYPDLCYVEFTGKPSGHLPKYQKCFVNDFNFGYGGSAGMQWYKDGAPVELTVNMRLTEVSIVTRNVLRGEKLH